MATIPQGPWAPFHAEVGAGGETVTVSPPHLPVYGRCLRPPGGAGTGLWFGPAIGVTSEIVALRSSNAADMTVDGVITMPGAALTARRALEAAERLRTGPPQQTNPAASAALAAALAKLHRQPLTTLVVRGPAEPAIAAHLHDALRRMPDDLQRGLHFSTLQCTPDPVLRIMGVPEDLWDRASLPARCIVVDLARPREVPADPAPRPPVKPACPGCGGRRVLPPTLDLVTPHGGRRLFSQAARVQTERRLVPLMPHRCADCGARFHDTGPSLLVAGPPRCGATTLLSALERASGDVAGLFPIARAAGRVRLWADHRGTTWTVLEGGVLESLARRTALYGRGRPGTLLLCVDVAQLPGGAHGGQERPGLLREALDAVSRAHCGTDGWRLHVVVTKADRVLAGTDAVPLDPREFLEGLGAGRLLNVAERADAQVSITGGLHSLVADPTVPPDAGFVSQAGHIFRTVTQ